MKGAAAASRLPLAGGLPTVLAPMEGVTHPLFRQLMIDRGGLGMVCTEFVRIAHDPPKASFLEKAVRSYGDVPLSVQVMGNHISHMAEATGHVAAAGADVVDINLGCPMPRVVRKGVGSALLGDPKLLAELISAMRAATQGLLSAKMRAGVDSADRAVELAVLLEESGVDFLAVHPRRQKDRYGGVADWRLVQRIAETLSIPVIGNGDIWYASTAVQVLRNSGVAAVMIGRPALRNPWLFRQIRDLLCGNVPEQPSGEDVLAFLMEVRARYGPECRATLGRMKEMLRYFGRAVPDRDFGRQVLRQPDLDSVMAYCERHLAALKPEQLDLDAEGTLSLERTPDLGHVPSLLPLTG